MTTFSSLHTSKPSHNEYVSFHLLVLAWSMILFVWWLLFIMFFWADLKIFKPRSYFKYLPEASYVSLFTHLFTTCILRQARKNNLRRNIAETPLLILYRGREERTSISEPSKPTKLISFLKIYFFVCFQQNHLKRSQET